MSETLSKVISYLVFVFVLIAIVVMFLGKVDSSMEAYVKNETVEFVDECRTTGYINPDNYENYVQLISKLGSYRVKISHGAKKAYALYDGNSFTGKYTEEYVYTNLDQILQYMYPDTTSGVGKVNYEMHNGDELTVTVTRAKGIFSNTFAWLAGSSTGTDTTIITYSGKIGNSPD